MKHCIGSANHHQDNGGVYSDIYYEFDGETYTYSMSVGVNHHYYSSNTDVVLGSSVEPPVEYIDSLITALKKTKLHMLKNKWKGNVPNLDNPVQGSCERASGV